MQENRYQLIADQTELFKVAEALEKEKIIGVDLEGDSMFHYREKVCLIQISTQDRNFLIDPLSISDIYPLSPIFPNLSRITSPTNLGKANILLQRHGSR